MIRAITRCAMLSILVATLSGCLTVSSGNASLKSDFEGIELVLVRLDSAEPLIDQWLLLTPDGAGLRASGYAGCNTFSGPGEYLPDGRLEIGALFSTRRACSNPAHMDQENAYLAALGGKTFDVAADGERLVLSSGATRLEFTRR